MLVCNFFFWLFRISIFRWISAGILASHDFQCFSLKLSTQFSILHPSDSSILLEMLYAILYLLQSGAREG